MIVLILAAGRGSRLGNLEKSMLDVGSKKLIQYSLDLAIEIKPEKIIIVIPSKSQVPEYFHSEYKQILIEYIVQDNSTGTMDAIKLSISNIVTPFLLMLADEVLINSKVSDMISRYDMNTGGVIGFLEECPEEILKTYSINSFNDLALKLIEKPVVVNTPKKGTGYCIIGRDLLKKMIESREENFVEAIDYAIRKGMCIKIFNICKRYYNINTQKDLEKCIKEMEQR